MCSIDFTWSVELRYLLHNGPLCVPTYSAQMIATAIAVNTNGGVILSAGATYGILLAILFSHGIVCSAATSILARLNLFYVVINSKFYYKSILRPPPYCDLSRHNYCSNCFSPGVLWKS